MSGQSGDKRYKYASDARDKAKRLRDEGMSYGVISKRLGVPKGTLAFWSLDDDDDDQLAADADQPERSVMSNDQEIVFDFRGRDFAVRSDPVAELALSGAWR